MTPCTQICFNPTPRNPSAEFPHTTDSLLRLSKPTARPTTVALFQLSALLKSRPIVPNGIGMSRGGRSRDRTRRRLHPVFTSALRNRNG